MSLVKNNTYEGEVLALGTGGEGIIRTGDTTAFVPFCLIGEKVRFSVLKTKGDIAYGKVEKILKPSANRVEPRCPLFGKCGGCDLQHMDYLAQLDFKREQVAGALRKLGGIYAAVNAVVPSDNVFRYRNKLALPIGDNSCGEVILGFYARRSHRIVPTIDCAIQSEWIKKVISAVTVYARKCGLKGYDEVTGRGELRQIVVREIKGKFIVALVAAKVVPTQALSAELEKVFDDFTLLLNINASKSNVIFSNEWHICRGEGSFEAEEQGIFYSAGAETFLQVNDGMRERLYSRVIEEVKGAQTAVDLYSGGGLLTAMLAGVCQTAYGVEVVKEASACADRLCRRNGLSGRMINICGKVEDELDRVLKHADRDSVVVCDPPRKGMERSVVEKLKKCGAEKIVLISCNPATLARDLGILLGTTVCEDGKLVSCRENQSSDYEIVSVTPFDMFPQTRHVETLVVLKHI